MPNFSSVVAAVVLGQLLFDDVGLDRHAQVVGLAGQVGGDVIVLVGLEGGVAQVAPEDRRHAELVGMGKGFGHLDDLPRRFLGAEVDRRTDGRRAHFVGLFDRAEHHLVELVRIGEQLVVIDLDDERESCGRTCGRRCPSTPKVDATALQPPSIGQLDDVLRVEVSDSARTTHRPNARFPGRPAGSTGSRCSRSRPWPNSRCRLFSTRGLRSLAT